MDEPLSNLDAKLRVQMRTEMKAIHQRTQATTLFVTHDQSEAMSIADRIVIMKDGQIIQIGTPEEVYRDCANVFVAGFIGSPPANFYKMTVSTDNSKVKLENPDFSFIPATQHQKILKNYSKKELILAVRPENIVLCDKSSAILSREVMVVEPQGTHQVIAVSINDNITKIVVPAFPKLKPGETVNLDFNHERLHLFDVESEEKIG